MSLFESQSMKAKATIRLKFSTEKQAEIIFKSLKPETENPTTARAHTTLQKEGKQLTLRVEAKDTVALRATLNAYLRWINSILNVFEVLETQ
jgi:KEOPS complex subunit Pcc1